MRALVQRVLSAEVQVEGNVAGRIEKGLLVYVGVAVSDTPDEARRLAHKVAHLRIFDDAQGKINLSVGDALGGILAVPNFTLMADASRGHRPEFSGAARPQEARKLFEAFLDGLAQCQCRVASGVFGAAMLVHSVADGPINVVVDVTPSPP